MVQRFTPATDGIDHINMYSKGVTPFGQMLSDFFHSPVDTEHGCFESVEGLWYYLSLPDELPEKEQMRKFYGFFAKKKGREFRELAVKRGLSLIHDDRFEEKILAAVEAKIKANAYLWKPEYKGLPIMHYYAYTAPSGKSVIKDVTNDFPWLVRGIREIVNRNFT